VSAQVFRIGQRSPAPPARRVLVVAEVGTEPDELVQELVERSGRESIELAVLVVVPATERAAPSPDESARRVRSLLARLRAAGLYVREAGVAEGDLVRAGAQAARAGGADEIALLSIRRRLQPAAGPGLAAATGLPVTNVQVSPRAKPRLVAGGARTRFESELRRLGAAFRRLRAAAPRRVASPRILAVRVLAAAWLLLFVLALVSAASGDAAAPGQGPLDPAAPAAAR
jgi:hypothetical protein